MCVRVYVYTYKPMTTCIHATTHARVYEHARFYAHAHARSCAPTHAHAPSASEATRDTSSTAREVSAANEHAVPCTRTPTPLERAEQRRAGRIRAGACLSVASLRQTPSGVSSARQPAGPRSSARLFFGYFLLAKQKKVARPQGRNPVFPNFPSKISLSPT